MSTGFVYVMINPSIPKQVKIGRTQKTSDKRSKELRGTGVPDDFIVVYDELVTNCELVEQRIHERYKEYRTNPNREFFHLPIREAIKGLIYEAREFLVPRIGEESGIEILPELKRKYQHYLKTDFYSIKIVHINDVVFLETIRMRHAGILDEIIERTDLGFIIEGDDSMFPPSRTPSDNARIFINQLDEFSMINCTDIFTDDACNAILMKRSVEINQKREKS